MSSITLKVEGMSCLHCVNTIEGALSKIGVLGKVDLINKNVKIQYDENKLSLSVIRKMIEDNGYDVIN